MIFKSWKSPYASYRDVVLCDDPATIEEVEHEIRLAMTRGRVLRIKSNIHSDPVPKHAHKVFRILHELSVKYRPWQFNTLAQVDGSWGVDWVEVDQWLHKYGAISKLEREW